MNDSSPTWYARRAFGCGLGFPELKKRFAALDENTQETLERVAWRMSITRTLRYNAAFTSHRPRQRATPEQLQLSDELDSLELYLLVTCIDTVANAGFQHFPDWLRETQPANGTYSRDKVESLHETWRKELGPTANMRRFFHETLPDSLVIWLQQTVRIYPSDRRPDDQPPWTVPNEMNELRDLLFKYFSQVRRNPYTHRSESHPTVAARDIPPAPEEGWTFPRGTFFRLGNKEHVIAFRKGRDETTVLRMIVIACCLEELEVEVTENLIESHIENLSRIHSFHGLRWELEANSHEVERWATAKNRKSDVVWSAVFRGVPLLALERTVRVLGRLWDNPLESGVREQLKAYERIVKTLRDQIDAFNDDNPPREPESWKNQSEEFEARVEALVQFLNTIADSEGAEVVLSAPSELLPKIGLILDDPCYT